MMDRNDYEQQEAEGEFYEITLRSLRHAAELGVPDIEMRVLSWHCGIDYDKEIKPYGSK